MTSKDLHIAIKKGHGVQYMLKRHGFDSEDSLFEAIRGVSPSGADGFISDLKKNQKRIDRRNAKNNNKPKVDSNVSGKSDDGEAFEEELIVQFTVESDTATVEEEISIYPKITLEQLLEDEKEMSDELCRLETEHNILAAQRRDCRARFTKGQKALAELQRLIRAQQDNVRATYEEYEALERKMKDNSKECAEYSKLLNLIRAQIQEMRKITIFVYENGVIEVENAKLPSISEESLNAGVTNLISLPDAEELTIKQLKTIAKVRLIVDAIKQDDCEFELEFDSLEVQKFYETVAA